MRTLASGAAAALSASTVAAVMLIEMDFSPVFYACTAPIDVVWNGQTWIGAGPVGAIDPVKDSTGVSEAVRFTMSSVPSENISLALGTSVRNTVCKVYFAILDPATHVILDAPLVWAGVLDQMPITEGGQTSTIGVTAKHIGSLFSRIKTLRYTASDQKKVSPGDTSLRFITSQAGHKDIWPAASFFKQ